MFIHFQSEKEIFEQVFSGEKESYPAQYTKKNLEMLQAVDTALCIEEKPTEPVYMILQCGYEKDYSWVVVEVSEFIISHGHGLTEKAEKYEEELKEIDKELPKLALEIALKYGLSLSAKKIEKFMKRLAVATEQFEEADRLESRARENGTITNSLIMGLGHVSIGMNNAEEQLQQAIIELLSEIPKHEDSTNRFATLVKRRIELTGFGDDDDENIGLISEINGKEEEAENRWDSFERDYNENPVNFFLERFKVSANTVDDDLFWQESKFIHYNVNYDLFEFEIKRIIDKGNGDESLEALKKNLSGENACSTKEFFEELTEKEYKEIFLEANAFIKEALDAKAKAKKAKRKSTKPRVKQEMKPEPDWSGEC